MIYKQYDAINCENYLQFATFFERKKITPGILVPVSSSNASQLQSTAHR